MPKVFISYRQLNDVQRQRVRNFAEHVRDCGIEVELDQFYKDIHPGGPAEGWPKWSNDQAISAERILIIGSASWFRCFDGAEAPDTGLGAACEAGNIRQRLYDLKGKNDIIRVVIFDDADAARISFDLKRYDRFHAERDFAALIKWLGGAPPELKRSNTTATPNNLPRLQSFFGRDKELAKIADALSPKTRTWGALIDGPGGMGKTSLAVRAAELAPPGQFQRILFLSSKERKMTGDGEQKLTNFVVPGYLDMLNEIARLLKQPDLAKHPQADRARLVIDLLEPAQALLILDNLESLPKEQQNQLFEFLSQLPSGCKAIATSRRRTDVDARIIRLEKLDQDAALALLAELATDRPLLAKATNAERIHLYEETGGNPLLLRWIAGQLGKSQCRTVASALEFIRGAPADNDPLEFIFGDLLETFTENETKVLAALAHFTRAVEVKFIAELANITRTATQTALGDLASRALVVPDEEEKNFVLVAMVADFLRKKRPEAVQQTGVRLADHAYALIVENGYSKYECFPVLHAAWPTIAPALPIFIAGPNSRLQTICDALQLSMEYTGRWDELLSLEQQGETKALAARDYFNAGWRVYWIGWIHFLRRQPDAVLECAARAEKIWEIAKASARERSFATELLGAGHQLKKDFQAAISAYRTALELRRTLSTESADVAIALNALADVEQQSGDLVAAERDYREALRVSRVIGYAEGVATFTTNLAAVAVDRKDWPRAEAFSREALPLAEKLGRQALIALLCRHLAEALVQQKKPKEALPHAQRAVEIFTQIGSPELEGCRAILAECES